MAAEEGVAFTALADFFGASFSFAGLALADVAGLGLAAATGLDALVAAGFGALFPGAGLFLVLVGMSCWIRRRRVLLFQPRRGQRPSERFH